MRGKQKSLTISRPKRNSHASNAAGSATGADKRTATGAQKRTAAAAAAGKAGPAAAHKGTAPAAIASAAKHRGIESTSISRPRQYTRAAKAASTAVAAETGTAAVAEVPTAAAAAVAAAAQASTDKHSHKESLAISRPKRYRAKAAAVGADPAVAAAAAEAAAAAAVGTAAKDSSNNLVHQPPQFYVIRCSRKSRLVECDDESFVDRWKDEITEAQDEIDDDVTYSDGSWLFDMGWCEGPRGEHPADKPTHGLARTPGIVRIYSSLAAANAAGALVWRSLQVNRGFVGVAPDSDSELSEAAAAAAAAAKGSGRSARGMTTGIYSRRDFVFEYDDEYEDEDQQDSGADDPDFDPAFDQEDQEGAGRNLKRRLRKRSRAVASSGGGSSSSRDRPCNDCKVRADGRCSWSRTRRFHVDPWWSGPGYEPLHNIVSSTLDVEVVRAQVE